MNELYITIAKVSHVISHVCIVANNIVAKENWIPMDLQLYIDANWIPMDAINNES